jgi:hypothetical protein
MSNKNLYLGTSAIVNGYEFDFHTDGRLFIPSPTEDIDIQAVNKLYVDKTVNSQKVRIDAILSGTTIDLDTLTEIVNFATTIKTDGSNNVVNAVLTLNTIVADISNNLTSEINSRISSGLSIVDSVRVEEETRTYHDAMLSNRIDAVSASLYGYKGRNDLRSVAIENSIQSNRVATLAADVVLQTNIDTLQTNTLLAASSLRDVMDVSMNYFITTEQGARYTADTIIRDSIFNLDASFNNAVSNLQVIDQLLKPVIVSETSARINSDNNIGARIGLCEDSVLSNNNLLTTNVALLNTNLLKEKTDCTTEDQNLLDKINMLFFYFFRHSSTGVYINQDNEIQIISAVINLSDIATLTNLKWNIISTVTILSGQTLTINENTEISDTGNLINNGSIFNLAILKNNNLITLNSGSYFSNTGMVINNNFFSNGGTIENMGIIENNGNTLEIVSGGILENNGTINNKFSPTQ